MAEKKQTKSDYEQLAAENTALKAEVDRLKDELVRLVGRNLDLTERLEYDVELRRRTEIARELLEGNIQRQRNADLQDDGQLMAIIEMRVEKDRPHLSPDFNSEALAEMLGVSRERLARLFRHQTIHRTPDAYIDNLRVLAALRLLREKPMSSTTCVCWQPCVCYAKSPCTTLPPWPKKPASVMSVPCSAVYKMPLA